MTSSSQTSSSCDVTHVVPEDGAIVLDCSCDGCTTEAERVRWSYKKNTFSTTTLCDIVQTNSAARISYSQDKDLGHLLEGLTCSGNLSVTLSHVTSEFEAKYCCERLTNTEEHNPICHTVTLQGN